MDQLSPQLRDEYRKKLADKHSTLVVLPAFLGGCIAGLLLFPLATGANPAGIMGLAAILIAGALVSGAALSQWTEHRQAKMAAWPDDLLVVRYNEFQQQKTIHRIWNGAAAIAVAGFMTAVAISNPAETALFLSSAACKVIGQQTRPAPGGGYEVRTQIGNTGEGGAIRIFANLSTPGGDVEKTRDVAFGARENRVITFPFPETATMADAPQAAVSCRP